MAALNISHELLALKSGDSPIETNEEHERLSALNSQLDEVLYQLRQRNQLIPLSAILTSA